MLLRLLLDFQTAFLARLREHKYVRLIILNNVSEGMGERSFAALVLLYNNRLSSLRFATYKVLECPAPSSACQAQWASWGNEAHKYRGTQTSRAVASASLKLMLSLAASFQLPCDQRAVWTCCRVVFSPSKAKTSLCLSLSLSLSGAVHVPVCVFTYASFVFICR